MKKKRKKYKKIDLTNIQYNLGEMTIEEYLADDATKIKLKILYESEAGLNVKHLIEDNIKIEDLQLVSNSTDLDDEPSSLNDLIEDTIPEDIHLLESDTSSTSYNQLTLAAESEVAVTVDIESDVEQKKRELEQYLQSELKFKEFDKKLIEVVRERPIERNSSSFYKFFNKFFS